MEAERGGQAGAVSGVRGQNSPHHASRSASSGNTQATGSSSENVRVEQSAPRGELQMLMPCVYPRSYYV
eukprot:5459986-Pleurochrysis_carterae.AAC.1